MNAGMWALAIGVVALVAAPALGGVADVKVTTDRSIDCTSVQTIARDLYANCKTDEEKAVATWYFVRRLHFHWPTIPTWDSIDLINSYGFALCGYQSTMYVQIATAGGLKARTMHPTKHVIAEAYYDGAWHMFDCQVGWFARNRKGAVANCAEMTADPTIVTDARCPAAVISLIAREPCQSVMMRLWLDPVNLSGVATKLDEFAL